MYYYIAMKIYYYVGHEVIEVCVQVGAHMARTAREMHECMRWACKPVHVWRLRWCIVLRVYGE